MKTQRRVLALFLTLCMVFGLLPAMCLVSWADEAEGKINRAIASKMSKLDGVDVTKELTDGKAGATSDYYWSTYGQPCMPDPINSDSGAWFSVDLGAVYTIDAINVVGRIGNHYYHWEVYGTTEKDAALENWDKLGEKITDEVSTELGYTVELEQPTAVRYLRIYGTYTSSTEVNTLQLCEIEIWDYEDEYKAPEEEPDNDDDKPAETPVFPPAVPGDEVDPDENNTPDTTDTTEENGNDSTLVVIIVIAAIAVVVIGAGVWFAVKKKRT